MALRVPLGDEQLIRRWPLGLTSLKTVQRRLGRVPRARITFRAVTRFVTVQEAEALRMAGIPAVCFVSVGPLSEARSAAVTTMRPGTAPLRHRPHPLAGVWAETRHIAACFRGTALAAPITGTDALPAIVVIALGAIALTAVYRRLGVVTARAAAAGTTLVGPARKGQEGVEGEAPLPWLCPRGVPVATTGGLAIRRAGVRDRAGGAVGWPAVSGTGKAAQAVLKPPSSGASEVALAVTCAPLDGRRVVRCRVRLATAR